MALSANLKTEILMQKRRALLEDLNDYKAPTEKRFHDGAAIGKLKITYQGKTYESTEFDHGNPPVEIEKFVDKLQSFAKAE